MEDMIAAPTVFIVDADTAARKSLERVARSAGYAAAAFASGREFLSLRRGSEPGCLILELFLPGLNGLALQEKLAREEVPLPVIFLTGNGDIRTSVKAMKAGAVDFLTKPFEAKMLLNAVARAIAQDAQAKREREHLMKARRLLDTLTPREYEVLRWVLTGLTNRQVALELGIVEKTVKAHRGRIMRKMRAPSPASLILFALEAGVHPARPHVFAGEEASTLSFRPPLRSLPADHG
jgi:FixJ family two-component response regulator